MILLVLACKASAQNASLPKFGHVVIVVGENSSYGSTYNSGAMPYLDSLANKYGLGINYFADTHPSIGNYFALATGQILTNDDGQDPSSFPVSADNIALEVQKAGKTWKDYVEDLPSVSGCGGVNSGSYYVRHDPLEYMTTVNTQTSNYVCFSQFATDLANHALPNLSWLVPNGCDDAHDCSDSTFDNWLQTEIDPLLQSSYFQPGGDGLLLIVFDEDDGSGSPNCSTMTTGQACGGQVEFVAASPYSLAGYQSNVAYEHENILRLIAQGLGLNTASLGAGSSAAPMSDFFSLATTAGVTLAPTSATLVAGAGSSASQAFTLRNGTASSVGITSITLIPGTLGGEFTQSNNCSTLSASGGSCTVTVTFTPASNGTATATLSIIDTASATALTASLTGTNSDFALTTPTSSGVTITAGQTATYTLDVSPVGGFSQTVSLACSGAPPASTCTISPSSVTLDGSTTATATVTVATTARSGGLPLSTAPPASHPRLPLPVLWLAVLSAGLAAVRKYPQRRAQAAATLLAATLFLVMVWAGCGGGSASVSSNHSGTPAGNYSLTVTASATSGSTTLQHTTTLPLTVN